MSDWVRVATFEGDQAAAQTIVDQINQEPGPPPGIPAKSIMVGYDHENNHVRIVVRFDETTGASLGVFASGGGLSTAVGLTFGSDGNLYVGSRDTNQILRYSGPSSRSVCRSSLISTGFTRCATKPAACSARR